MQLPVLPRPFLERLSNPFLPCVYHRPGSVTFSSLIQLVRMNWIRPRLQMLRPKRRCEGRDPPKRPATLRGRDPSRRERRLSRVHEELEADPGAHLAAEREHSLRNTLSLLKVFQEPGRKKSLDNI